MWLPGHGGAWQCGGGQVIVRRSLLLTDVHRSREQDILSTAWRVPDPATALILEDLPMTDAVKVGFVPFSAAPRGILVVFCDDTLQFGAATRKTLGAAVSLVKRAADTNQFKGKSAAALDILAPAGLKAKRLIVVGVGKVASIKENDFLKLGGTAAGKLRAGNDAVTIVAELPAGAMTPDQAAAVASGLRLRAYKFDRYKTKKKDGEDAALRADVSVAVGDVTAARRAFAPDAHIVDGVITARDLVNEPPNVLFPVEFARRAGQLRKVGVDVDILDVKAMTKLGMGALLGVAQGSTQPGRTVIMRWNGGKRGDQPVAFIGKGVCFDAGGISIKSAGGMEDMKGDMGGAACVVGLMHALAARKAKVNVVGAIGLVENMPDGNAQRPGDIVTSMSGQTIEIINTDAEGRLVLADVLWYVAKKFKPKFMIDLATLTGAIMVALGTEYAGLFSNNDELAERLTTVGLATGERVWRMPLGPEYDKQIDSQFADMKNTGTRNGGSITAAQFLQRFVDGTPWAHLDIAGTAMGAPKTEINQSWGSGYGVRLLERLVAEYYEAKK
jgi:leucyl aminopeptidase